ncbi:MAG: hypothetical protein ACT4O5_09700 [Gammaproteobacteria bacterium]
MPASASDQELWAARIRLHFKPHLRDIAEEAALAFVPLVGPRIKQLRPDTAMGEVIAWAKEAPLARKVSLDWVESIMALEEIVDSQITDEFAEEFERHTFREVVTHLYVNRQGV